MAEQGIQTLVAYLSETTSADAQRRRQAEHNLEKISATPGVVILLLQLQQIQSIDAHTRLAAAVFFKNFIKANWVEKEDGVAIAPNDREQIKGVLVNLMLSVPGRIQRVISEALSIISSTEFPGKWQSLLPELVSKFSTTDFAVINGVLKTIHSIFKGYRHKFRSDEVLGELKYILTNFQVPFLQLFVQLGQAIDGNVSNPEPLKTLFGTANLLCKIFYSLNAIDLPEYFEDNMTGFMTHFSKYLTFQTTFPALLEGRDENKPGLLLKVQTQVCCNIHQYTEKYEEEFHPFLGTFVQQVWGLLAKSTLDVQYDKLVHAAIRFLTSVATSIHHSMFGNEGALQSLCGNIVIPNMRLRDADEELFEDNPVDYIRGDIEGGDTDTRRRSALELVKGLRKHYESQVTNLFSADITRMLTSYAQNPAKNWKDKDTAVYLVTALAVRSATAQAGTTSTNQLVPIVDFFNSQIVPDLQAQTCASPLLKADALKFVSTFRRQIPKDMYPTIFPYLVNSLADRNYVIHTYAAASIERFLTEKDRPKFSSEVYARTLTGLMHALQFPGSQENEYLMKASMRLLTVAGPEITNFAGECLKTFTAILTKVAVNPTNPSYNHYLFEAVASLVRTTCTATPTAITTCEALLFPVFQQILQNDVIEFAPYVFQILSMMIDLTGNIPNRGPLPAVYTGLFMPFLNPALWQRSGNIPALVPLIQSYIRQAPEFVAPAAHLQAVLGVFQKLNSSSIHDHEAFYILEAIVQYLKLDEFRAFLPEIFKLIFRRITEKKTTKYVKSFLVFLSVFIGKHDPTLVVKTIDTIQERLFSLVLESLWIPNIAKVNGIIERKMASIAMTRLMTECTALLTDYHISWPKLLNAQLIQLELPEDETPADDSVDDVHVNEESNGLSGAYSHLAYAAKQDVDPFPGVDPKAFFATGLSNLSRGHPGKISPLIQQNLSPHAQEVLTSYFKRTNVPLPYLA